MRALSVMMPPERAHPDQVGDMLATFARHPRLTRAYLTFNVHLLMRNSLPPRFVETVVLRTAVCRGREYLWNHHVPLALRAGLTDEDLGAIRAGEAHAELDSAIIAAVDELHESSVITDATWRALCAHLDEKQLMDLVFTAGGYGVLAMAIKSFGIEDEK